MRHVRIYAFVAGLWALMIIGGGIATLVLGQLHIDDADQTAKMALSVGKGTAAVLLVAAWVYVLSRVKRKIFASQMRDMGQGS